MRFSFLQWVGAIAVWAWVQGLGAHALDLPRPTLAAQAQVDGRGVFLHQVLVNPPENLPAVRLADAPAFGRAAALTRTAVAALVEQKFPGMIGTNWSGAQQIRLARRSRLLNEAEFKELLTQSLQAAHVKDRGELELRLLRPWPALPVPDEALALKVIDVPSTGLAAFSGVRFELYAGDERLGSWQLSVQCKLWREVPVTASALRRGQRLSEADVVLEKRDILAQREILVRWPESTASLEINEDLPAGSALLNRSIRSRPLIRRGRLVEALVQEGALVVSMKVEALQDGLAGESVRVRNPKTKREFIGTVQNEQTVVIDL